MPFILITGGQRSGKSKYAQQLAIQESDKPIYLATARAWDTEFTMRINKHKYDRGNQWETIEEDRYLGELQLHKQTILLDCVTLWLTNIFHDMHYQVKPALEEAKREWDAFTRKDNRLYVVTNEIGMGIIPENEAARKFTDLQGWMNQYIAQKADKVIFMVSGIPLDLK